MIRQRECPRGFTNTHPFNFGNLFYDRTLHRAFSPRPELASGQLASAGPRKHTHWTHASNQLPPNRELCMRTPLHFHSISGTHSMTVTSTERFHRSVGWPPGSWHPPDRGSTLTEQPQPPDHPRPGKSAWVHTFTPIHFQEFIL